MTAANLPAMWQLLVLPACAARVPANPTALADGDRLEREGPVRIGLVGGLALAGPEVLADLRGQDLAFVLLAGDAVPRGTRTAWAELYERLDGLPVVPLPGDGERRGDRQLARFGEVWDGIGVRGLDDPVPWRAFDLRSAGTTWRMILLDADREALGSRWADELFWLPKAIACDAPLLVVANRPIRTLVDGRDPAGWRGAEELHALVRRHADPTRVVLVATSGTTSPELALPGGAWGEGWLGIGRVAGDADRLLRARDRHVLEPGLDEALSTWFLGPELEPGPSYDDVLGWWRIELDGASLSATLRMASPAGWQDVYTLRWAPDAGWSE